MPTFILNAQEMAELDVRITGDGGFQTLMRRLQVDLNQETGEITVAEEDVERLRRYCTQYGQGGWQDRFVRAFRRVLGQDLD